MINSTLAFICAFFITTFIHESGHFITYLIFGADPVLYHNYVQAQSDNLSTLALIITVMAGPVASLLQGIAFSIWAFMRRKKDVMDLLILWLGLLGLVNFFGYLLLTPFSTAGDTGKAATLLQLGVPSTYFIAAAGLTVVIVLVLKIGRIFADFIPADLIGREKGKYVYAIMFYPILIGSVVNTALAFPVPTIVSILYPATSAFVIMSSFRAILRSHRSDAHRSELRERIQLPLVVLTLVCVMMNRLLTLGWG